MKETKLILKKIYRIIVIKFFEILYGKIEFKKVTLGAIFKKFTLRTIILKKVKKKNIVYQF